MAAAAAATAAEQVCEPRCSRELEEWVKQGLARWASGGVGRQGLGTSAWQGGAGRSRRSYPQPGCSRGRRDPGPELSCPGADVSAAFGLAWSVPQRETGGLTAPRPRDATAPVPSLRQDCPAL